MSRKTKWTFFNTPIGKCGIVWDESRLAGVQLPEPNPEATEARLRRRWPGAEQASPPAQVQSVIDRIGALLGSGHADFSEVELDLDRVPQFNRRVYEITRAIPPGQVLTYGEVARRLGDPALAREVGQAMGQNPFPLVIPCHRVVAAGGKVGGFSGGMGTETKLKLLGIEGAVLGGQPTLFDGLPTGGS